jgi:hypothetical protein
VQSKQEEKKNRALRLRLALLLFTSNSRVDKEKMQIFLWETGSRQKVWQTEAIYNILEEELLL